MLVQQRKGIDIMFRCAGCRPIPTDPFNFLRNRNVRNTEKRTYNCGGYALGTFSWYCPHRAEDDLTHFGNYYAEDLSEAEVITQHSVQVMLDSNELFRCAIKK